jgi:hypothetical protein
VILPLARAVIIRVDMPSHLVTCPESAHLEEIEYEDHPLGLLIVACSRFTPACAVTCERLCAARLDRKRRGSDEFLEEEDTLGGEDTVVGIRY